MFPRIGDKYSAEVTHAVPNLFSNSRGGFALRAFIVLLVLLSASAAFAGTITEINTPGAFSLATAQWVNSTGASGFGNKADGTPFYGNSAGIFNLQSNADWFALTPVGQWSDGTNMYTLGSGLFSDFQEYGVVWTNGTISSTHLGFLFQGADQFGNFAGTNGVAVWGSINTFLASGTFNSRPLQPGEFSSNALTVQNGVVAGVVALNNTSLRALCGSSVMGTNASANAVDAISGNCLGTENDYAAIFNPVTNSIGRLPDVSGVGYQRGRITSGIGGIYTIEYNGQTFYSNGVTTWTSAQYTVLRSLSADPIWARFVADALSGRGGRVGRSSFDLALTDNYVNFNPDGGTGEIPEPGTKALMTLGLAALCICLKRGLIRPIVRA